MESIIPVHEEIRPLKSRRNTKSSGLFLTQIDGRMKRFSTNHRLRFYYRSMKTIVSKRSLYIFGVLNLSLAALAIFCVIQAVDYPEYYFLIFVSVAVFAFYISTILLIIFFQILEIYRKKRPIVKSEPINEQKRPLVRSQTAPVGMSNCSSSSSINSNRSRSFRRRYSSVSFEMSPFNQMETRPLSIRRAKSTKNRNFDSTRKENRWRRELEDLFGFFYFSEKKLGSFCVRSVIYIWSCDSNLHLPMTNYE